MFINELKNSKPPGGVNLVFTVKIWLSALFQLDRGSRWIEFQIDYPRVQLPSRLIQSEQSDQEHATRPQRHRFDIATDRDGDQCMASQGKLQLHTGRMYFESLLQANCPC